jgi:hypothetical protein
LRYFVTIYLSTAALPKYGWKASQSIKKGGRGKKEYPTKA